MEGNGLYTLLHATSRSITSIGINRKSGIQCIALR